MDEAINRFIRIGFDLTEPYSNDIKRMENNIDIVNKIDSEYKTNIDIHDSDFSKDSELSYEGLKDNIDNIQRNFDMSLKLIDSLNKDTKNLASSIFLDSKKRKVMDIIFNNIKHDRTNTIKTNWIYGSESKIYLLFRVYKSLYLSLKYLNPNDPETFISSFYSLDSLIINYLKNLIPNIDKLKNDSSSFYERLNDLIYYIDKHDYNDNDSWKLIVGLTFGLKPNNKSNPIDKTIYDLDLLYDTYNICEEINMCEIKLKHYEITPIDKDNQDNLYTLMYFFSSYIKAFSLVLLDIVKDMQIILNLIEPPEDKDIDRSETLMSDIENINPWISADYHLLKEYRKGENNSKRTDDIINMHNKIVKPNDVFLFLGDITESEFFDTSSNSHLKEVIKAVKKMNGHKILIIGNNDTGSDNIYKEMGFEEIYHNPIETKNFIFSHGPIETKNKLNIHGHIHGSKEYYNIDYKNHIDCYFGLWGKPVKLLDLEKYYNSGMYIDCKTVNKKYSDPETKKKPQVIK